MTNEIIRPEWWQQEVDHWIEMTGWPTGTHDIRTALEIYNKWKNSQEVPQYGSFRCTHTLVDMLHHHMQEKYSERDAAIISAALIPLLILMARKDGLTKPFIIT